MISRRLALAAFLAPPHRLPKHACDTHTHIFGDPRRFPFFPGRAYTPPTALPHEMSALHRRLGIDRVVIVTPSVYGTDNSATLFGLRARGSSARGIAVIDDTTPTSTLNQLARSRFCGARLNLGAAASGPESARRSVERLFDRVSGLRWHLQLFAGLKVVAALEDLLARAPIPVCIDPVAGALPDLGLSQPGFDALLRLLASGKTYVKITNRFLPSGQPQATAAMVAALHQANPNRILWGTDWPHPDNRSLPGRKPTDLSPFEPLDDLLWLERFLALTNDPARTLVANPATLYGF
ncbi:MAG: amidohydrolase family protein [Acidobacteriota bacterium]